MAISSRLRWNVNGSTGLYTGGGERNTKYTYGTGLGWSFTPAFQLLANHSQILYQHPSKVGYFAPARIQINELATYLEFEGDRALLVIDAGAVGVQRVRRPQSGVRYAATGNAWICAAVVPLAYRKFTRPGSGSLRYLSRARRCPFQRLEVRLRGCVVPDGDPGAQVMSLQARTV